MAAVRVIVGSALICLPGILLCAGLLFAFDAREVWMFTAGVLLWLAGGVLVADWKAVLLVGIVSAATAIFVYLADPWSPGDSGPLIFYLFVALPYTAISAVIVSAGVLIDRVSA
jgi:hypothetical protein